MAVDDGEGDPLLFLLLLLLLLTVEGDNFLVVVRGSAVIFVSLCGCNDHTGGYRRQIWKKLGREGGG